MWKGLVMQMRRCGTLGFVISAFALALQLSTVQASAQDRRQECSTRYKAAKEQGTLGGATWPQFFSRCMAELKTQAEAPAETPTAATPEPVTPLPPPAASAAESPAPATPAPPPAAAATPAPTPPEAVNPLRPGAAPTQAQPSPPHVAPAAPVVPSATLATPPAVPPEPVFPTAIAPAYAKAKPSVARQKTCQDQYNANKATDSNAGMKWVAKGGGYMSECIKRLKGQS
jgi:hypothetical protein